VLLAGNLDHPFGVAVDPVTNDVYVSNQGDNKVVRIGATGSATTVVGQGAPGAAGNADLSQPHDVLFQPNTRNLFIASTYNNKLFRFDVATGQVVLFAGAGGLVSSALSRPYSVAFDAAGEHLFLVTGGGVDEIDLKAMTTRSYPAGGGGVRTIAMDSKSNLYVGNNSNSLRVVDAAGKASAVPGTVSAPKDLATDADDNLVIADTESDTIRLYDPVKRTIKLIAGGGSGMLDGPPEMAKLNRPHGVAVDRDGRILIADSMNNRVLAIIR
jgi:DNA-binding beta-propeller fold protein YncE